MKSSARKRPLLVLPGLTSPYSARYRASYAELRRLAGERGVDLRILHYPGQPGPKGQSIDGEFTPDGAVQATLAALKELNAGDQPFSTLGISFGCNAAMQALRVASTAGIRFEHWQRALLWGPIPHWRHWRVSHRERDPMLGEGTRFAMDGRTYAAQAEALEDLVPNSPSPGPRVDVAVGSLDRAVTEYFLRDLEALCRGATSSGQPLLNAQRRDDHQFHLLPGVGHNPKPEEPGWGAFVDLVLAT